MSQRWGACGGRGVAGGGAGRGATKEAEVETGGYGSAVLGGGGLRKEACGGGTKHVGTMD